MGDSYRPERDRPRRDGAGGAAAAAKPAAPKSAAPEPTAEEKQAAAQAEYNRLLTARSGGVYVPPARLRALQAQVQDKTSEVYQRMAWEALKKSINGLVNKATAGNMREIVNELFRENLVRGRGLLTQSLIKAQYASPPFTPVYACIAACVNSKLPGVGELLLQRVLQRFKKGFKRNDKAVCRSAATFLAHLVNTQVADEMLAAQLLLLLLEKPTNDSVEIAIGLAREVGSFLETLNPTVLVVVFDRFHHILNEADIDKRTQYAIEVLFQQRRDHFAAFPAVRDDLDLIEEEDQIKHAVDLDDKLDEQRTLNIFRYDADWEAHEAEYARLRREILNESDDNDDDDSASDSGSDSDSDSSSDAEDVTQKALDVKDRTNADLVALRRTIYLTIQSSMNADEAVHKLLAVPLPDSRETELPSMVIECCSQEKTYTKFFGLVGERLAKLNRRWTTLFEESFGRYYSTIHRYDTSKLRNIACFFGHQFASDAIGWYVLETVRLTEDDTTSASRIFIKILFQQIAEAMGMAALCARLAEPTLLPSLEGLFPVADARNLRFSINYFTSIGMGVLTEEMRERLQNLPKPALPAADAPRGRSHSHSRSRSDSISSYSSYTSSSYSRSPSPRRDRSRDVSRSRRKSRDDSRPPRRSVSYDSRSPAPRKRGRSPSYSDDSRSPPPRRRRSFSAVSRSPRRGRSDSRSVSRPRRRNSSSVSEKKSRSPVRRRGRSPSRTPSRSPSRTPSRTPSRSPSPVHSCRATHNLAHSRSRTPRTATRGRSRSRSPVKPRDSGPADNRRRRSVSRDSRNSQGPPKKYQRSNW